MHTSCWFFKSQIIKASFPAGIRFVGRGSRSVWSLGVVVDEEILPLGRPLTDPIDRPAPVISDKGTPGLFFCRSSLDLLAPSYFLYWPSLDLQSGKGLLLLCARERAG